MFIVMESNQQNAVDWVAACETEEWAIKIAREREKVLGDDDVVFVVPAVYLKQGR